MADKIMFNGKEISLDELNKKMSELKVLQSLQKEAKKAGLIKKTTKEPKERSANFNLVLASFTPVVETNSKIITSLFTEYAPQDSISFDVNKDYHVIIRSKAVVAKKMADRKAATKTEEKPAEPAKDTLKDVK